MKTNSLILEKNNHSSIGENRKFKINRIKNKINDFGKKSNPKFICVKLEPDRVSKCLKMHLLCLETKETEIALYRKSKFSNKKYNPFSRGIYFNKIVKQQIDKIGLNSDPQFVCIDPLSSRKKSDRFIKIQCLESKEIKEVQYFWTFTKKSNPFARGRSINFKIENIINGLGRKCSHKFICLNPFFISKNIKSQNRHVLIQSIKTKETKVISFVDLKKRKNPFKNKTTKHSRKKIMNILNSYGEICTPKFFCINHDSKPNHKNRWVKIKSLETGEIKEVVYKDFISRKLNPFAKYKKRKQNFKIIKKRINKMGKKIGYICLNPEKELLPNWERIVTVKSIKTKENKDVRYSSLKKGVDPFNPKGFSFENNIVHPMYEKIFKKHKVEYKRQFLLKRKFIDFMFKIKRTTYGLEIKSSTKSHSIKKIKNQIFLYKKISKQANYNFKEIFLSDPDGKFKKANSLSIKEFDKMILFLKNK